MHWVGKSADLGMALSYIWGQRLFWQGPGWDTWAPSCSRLDQACLPGSGRLPRARPEMPKAS